MLDLHRDWFRGIEKMVAAIFSPLPFSPNYYTAASIVFSLAFFAAITIAGNYPAALAFFVISAFLDFIDGAVARAKGLATARGAYCDNIADRYVEAITLFALFFVGLPDIVISAKAWIFLLIVGSMMTTYAKASAKEKGLSEVELKGGLMSRGERLIFVAAAIMFLNYNFYWVTAILAVAAVLANITAFQRIGKALAR